MTENYLSFTPLLLPAEKRSMAVVMFYKTSFHPAQPGYIAMHAPLPRPHRPALVFGNALPILLLVMLTITMQQIGLAFFTSLLPVALVSAIGILLRNTSPRYTLKYINSPAKKLNSLYHSAVNLFHKKQH